MTFSDLGLSEPILHALGDCGYEEPTPIQEKSIPIVAAGHDLIASAQTGTGKTAAFTLAIIDDIGTRPSGKGDTPLVLILTPTRELAQQIDENIREYGKYVNTRSVVVVGGVSSGQQINRIRKGVDFVVATPGRLIDLVEQRELDLRDVEFFILDEADRMLDMGFVHDVRRISDWVPRPRQTLLFSATMTNQVASLASTVQTNAQTVSVAPPATVADNIDQRVMYVDKADKPELLLDLLRHDDTEHTLVFTGTRVAAAMVTRHLEVNGVKASAIHSDKSQSQRQRALDAFTKGNIKVLVATDIVARGIDVDGISHVINYELPDDAENYIHRIGRTARAGRAGVAVSLCCINDVPQLRGVENLLKKPLEVVEEHDYHSPTVMACVSASAKAARTRARAGKGRSSGSKWAR
jgi:ATP-dependent RNA helicase RhlE